MTRFLIPFLLLSCSAPLDDNRVRVVDQDLTPVVAKALGRWNRAAGLGARTGPGGNITVRWGACIHGDGCTKHNPNHDTYLVELEESWEGLVVHELGHAFGASGHSARGILQADYWPEDCITPDDLEHLCAFARCSRFNPECP